MTSETAGSKAHDPSNVVSYQHYSDTERKALDGTHKLKMPTLEQLLSATFKQRRYLLSPWLREHENCMVYAATGVGKSLFAMSAALAVAGGGEFLGWRPDDQGDGSGWRVLYVDGEMHIADIQERARQLRNGMSSLSKDAVDKNLFFLARQHQTGGAQFPSITEQAGQMFILDQLKANKVDLVVLDNFSTLGEVEDENAAASFNAIQQFLLQLKVREVATMLVHHTGKAGDNFRGSSKLAATFETIIQLEHPQVTYRKLNGSFDSRPVNVEHGEARFRVKWDKVRAGSRTPPRPVVAHLATEPPREFGGETTGVWEFETVDLGRLDEILQRLPAGEFASQKEIGDFFGVSATMARKYLNRGIKLGIWTEETISRGLALGKRLRTTGKTEAPVPPDASWKSESLDDTSKPAFGPGMDL
jgi:KaiC/GvpD/RAD55 family RecA-like ATPase